MRHTEFWDAVDRVFPGGHGRALVRDLVIPELGSKTSEEALAQGIAPQRVWHEFRVAMDLPESYEFVHRKETKKENL